ncbi:MAG: VWA domain-containing protein [Lachnospiraceae bacterium]|nr:VWA domain-containing protein [Lachnospiraceae bacterium]
MKENLTEIVFILDRSGSMSGLESDTIGGFNSMIIKQQKEEGEAIVSTVLFDDKSEVIHDRIAIGNIKKLTDKDYYVRGCTALLDAVGGAIRHISTIQKYQREEDRPAKTLFIITTDGLGNASKSFSFNDIKKLIEERKEKYNWEFLFLGANIDAIEVAGSMGISHDREANYNCDEAGTALNYQVLESAISRVRRCKAAEMSRTFAGGAWKEDIDSDYNKRGKR